MILLDCMAAHWIACSKCLQLILDHLVIDGIPMEEASDLSLCGLYVWSFWLFGYLVQRDVKHVEILKHFFFVFLAQYVNSLVAAGGEWNRQSAVCYGSSWPGLLVTNFL